MTGPIHPYIMGYSKRRELPHSHTIYIPKYMEFPVTCRPRAKSRWPCSCRTYILVLLKESLLHQHCFSLEFWFLLLWTPHWLMSHLREENMDLPSALWTSVSACQVCSVNTAKSSRIYVLLVLWHSLCLLFLSYLFTCFSSSFLQ